VKVVFDTNILVSGFLWNGPQARLLDAGLESRLVVFSTGALLDELEATLSAPKFSSRLASRGLTASQLVERFRNTCIEVIPSDVPIPANLRDPDDLVVLSCAATVPVDFIVSGDKDLLVLGEYCGIPIVDSAHALALLGIE
jgi:putative PIN family toxin of toxin-antitoxin system